MAPQRNYYADLELPPTADVTEIKKQFRKLALKYHPDRNPGREQEVNSQFQIIQAAHEVLSDPEAKAKYDASFARSAASRYPASSGVRGNPWQNVSQQFPTPPRRGQPRTATSGAQRWNERFSAGVPPTAKQQTTPATAARAFESMRKGGAKSGQQDRPVPPPPPPPRTEGAKKRAEASFGAKKAGYYPRSNTPGDEPPVTNNNYYSSRMNAERAAEPVPDPLAQFREKSRTEESFIDPQQSSPYTKDGGEEASPSDGSPLNRAKGAKDPSRKEQRSEPASPPTPKRRGSSIPRKESRDGAQRSQNETGVDGRPRVVPVPPSSRPNSRPSSSYKAPTFNKPATPVNGAKDPSIFNFSLDDDTFVPDAPGTAQFRKSSSVDGINTNFVKDNTSATWHFSAGSGDNDSLPQNRSRSTNKTQSRSQSTNKSRSPIRRRPVATAKASNFGTQTTQNSTVFDPERFKFEPQMFAPRPSTPKKSGSPTRTSQMNAKKAQRTPSSDDSHYAWRGRNAQPKAATVSSPQAMDIDSPPATSPSATPISTPPPLAPTTPSVTSTPAPVPPPIIPSHPHHQHHSPVARNIHVEPSRPEWRPGNVTGLGQAQRQPEERKEIPINSKGSEDSEEFRATFEDFKNVAPFAPPKPGLKSFTELKDNLPFESQASAELHLNVPPQPQQLELPDPPAAPGLPLMVDGVKPNVTVWTKYLEEFEGYLRRWDIFNSQVVDHFATRKANISNARISKGYSFLGVRGDADVLEYYSWVEQDNGVRRIWMAACEEHETRFREFMAFREKMKMPI
ncbi:DnaJ-related protein rsp1 [Trichoderma asperellum]|uniref:DnaJ-related protein rsp1 n=1 Tax=Trichoderma asperellum TaxID=101201 RepID=A0A6V8QQ20_TRIAP|nr:DnaJ-related protein rsp1 [Trichoderma asperellum]